MLKTSRTFTTCCCLFAGGTSIEELAEKFPEKIVKVAVDVREGVSDAQAKQMVDGLGVTGDKANAVKQIKGLYDLFTQKDCTMVEVIPSSRILSCCKIVDLSLWPPRRSCCTDQHTRACCSGE